MKTNLLVFIVTAYCHCSTCNGKANQPTASGYYPKEGVTVAGPAWLPFHTPIEIQGIGLRKVQDRMHKKYRQGRYIDIFMSSHTKAKKFGRQQLLVKY